MVKLKDYNEKRSFETTPEPPLTLAKKKKTKSLIFVVQKHAASHLHYDFRLEADGVLKSFAVPKGPSLDPSVKRLAIHVEDHPFDYKDFEGTIPEGNYGAGTVMVWDKGTYQPLDEKTILTGLKKGKISFVLEGEKLKGQFSLVRLKNSDKDNEWLLMKGKDQFATGKDILKEDKSVLTDRTMDQIGKNQTIKEKKSLKTPHDKKPSHIQPMLSTLVDEPFDAKNWLFEIKWDGFRAIGECDGSKVSLYSRTFQPFNSRFIPIVEALKNLNTDAIFDGEIVIINKSGKSSFQDLQNYQRTGEGDLRYYIFDLLYYQGHDLRSSPLLERKKLLKTVLPTSKTSILQYSDHVMEEGKKIFAMAQKKGLEGIMAKDGGSTYISSRGRSWLKIKTHARQEALICGFTDPKKGRKEFGALVLGIFEKKKLRYIGNVGTGFSEKTLKNVMKELKPLITKACPFSPPLKDKTATWVKPELLCEISFSEWTDDGHMRHPSFLGLRTDKDPKQVAKEEKLPTSKINKSPPVKKSVTPFDEDLKLTHLDKVYFPKEGYTKGDLLAYYEEVAPFILPYLKNRAESLHRFPNGIQGVSFFQKNVGYNFPAWISTVPIQHKEEKVNYLIIPDKKTLLFAVNLGCIELNPLSSQINNLDNPDYLILDLDPEKISFDAVVETAQVIHELLTKEDIPHYCKTSGATGMHIYIPVGGKYSFEQTKKFAEVLAHLTHQKLPEITSIERSPAKRQKKVYVDFLQNNFGQTVAAPYCVRPRNGAPVSTPLDWSEVKPGLDPTHFNIKNTLKRLKKKGDLFAPVLGKGIDILKCLKKFEKEMKE